MDTHPDPKHALLVRRVDYAPDARGWVGNEDEAGEHHALVSLNEVPCFLRLDWESRAAGRVVHVGTFKLNLRQLAQAGYAVEKPGRQVRLRFVRDPDGTVLIRPNEGAPGLPVGVAHFAGRHPRA